MSAAAPGVRFLAAGDAALVVEFATIIDPAINALVQALDAALRHAAPAGLRETIPTLRSLLVQFDPEITDGATLAEAIRPLLAGLTARPAMEGRRWRLPVCYGAAHAPDLDEVAARLQLVTPDIVRLHAGAAYRAGMVGFLPGCAYLLGLPDALALPRRDSPRTRVPKGAVAMALSMSLVYPADSPGGWHLIGHCPVPLFDASRARPNLIEAGDAVRFEPTGEADIAAIARAVAAGAFDAERECAA